jgi:predicted phosphate transport protein (TIGR00153 family)
MPMLGWFRAIMPKEDRFFVLFERHAGILVQGARELDRLLQGGDSVPAACEAIVDLEHQADEITREVMQAVRRSFITPFDRSDIQELIQSMDDAIDRMNGTVKMVRLYEVTEFQPNMQAIGKVTVEAALLLAEAVPLLEKPGPNVARLTELTEKIVETEGRCDDLHDDGLKQLFRAYGHSAPMQFYVGKELYESLERVMDRFEDVANEISAIVIESV